MKVINLILFGALMLPGIAKAQIPEKIKNIFPAATIMHNNLAYA